MATGVGFVPSYLDEYLTNLLGGDGLLADYAPGGAWGVQPPSNRPRPAVRWWVRPTHDSGDILVQDGRSSRALTSLEVIVGILDVQAAEDEDRVYGTKGQMLNPPQKYIELGAARIYALLHSRQLDYGSFNYYSQVLGPAPVPTEEGLMAGQIQVFVGWRVQFRIS